MQAGLYRKISQMPVVLIPVHFDRDPINRTPSCRRSVVLRPFITNDFMTGVPAEPGSVQLPLQVSGSLQSLKLKEIYLFIPPSTGPQSNCARYIEAGWNLEGSVRPDSQAAGHHRVGMMRSNQTNFQQPFHRSRCETNNNQPTNQ